MAIPTAEDIGYPVRVHWAADTGPHRALVSVNTFVVHDTQGNMPYDEQVLTAADNNIASCHALILKSGELVFMVPLELTAWTPGNDTVAKRSINVEMSGFENVPYTDAQYKSMAAFYRWCVEQGCPIPATYTGKSGAAGIIGHQDVPNPYTAGKFGGASGHTDPGPLFDWGKFVALCKDEPGRSTESTTPPKLYEANPKGFDIGPGVLEVLNNEGMVALTNEDYYVAEGGKYGLPKRSFTYASRMGVTYRIEAIQDFDSNGKPADSWTRQIWKFEKEIK